jgi:hypothetical protein
MKISFRLALLLACCVAGSAMAHAATCPQLIKTTVEAYQATHSTLAEHDLTGALRFDQGATCLVELILSETGRKTKIVAEAKAAFQQNGSNANSGGSTNLVAKGTAAKAISLAAEYGGLTETTSGSTVTVQGSLGGVPALLIGRNIVPDCSPVTAPNSRCISSRSIANLDRFSYGVGFDTSQSSQSINGTAASTGSGSATQPVVFTADNHTISSVTAKAVLLRGASASATDVIGAVGRLATTDTAVVKGKAVGDALTALTTHFPDDAAALTAWRKAAFSKLASANGDQIEAAWDSLGASLVSTLSTAPYSQTTLVADSVAYANAFSGYRFAVDQFVESLRKAPVLSTEYNYNRPASQPTNSTIRLIYGQAIASGFTYTINAAASFYNSAPSSTIPDAGSLRDLQFAAEGTYNFGKLKRSFLGNSTASLAYYYQDQTSPAILNVTPGQPVTGAIFTGLPSTATQIYAQKGMINVAQGKFTLRPARSNISLPISATWSNRTELVTQPVWRGQIGISYDFDSLFSPSGK